ncbi:MAG: aspartate/glutamate racemase family protein [Anaerolineales bacterium]|nr:aspartate/glutamate racemase family protein [Anaerolineales bacterium]MCS7247493.1 aspartate/glutamate racemase family protein [Anaerolineales bacterium]MDW8161304.1 aspartate/glutamate racemase family protein [Anaerolineales bacterium]MDW8448108.1 aspartate/glutamate racemase family protein [Anaerolineales bacterium]
MGKRLAYIHTVAGLTSTFKALSEELLPGVDLFHIVDESLLQNTIRANQLTAQTMRRLLRLIVSAEEAGAEIVMVTCSSMGPAVEASRPFVSIPVLRVDEPMAQLAVQSGSTIGVAATLQTTLKPTVDLITHVAAQQGRAVRVVSKLCEGAFQAVVSGDPARHDQLVAAGLQELVPQVEVVVLAQASMARVVESLPEEMRRIPILSSPRLAVERLAQVIPTL